MKTFDSSKKGVKAVLLQKSILPSVSIAYLTAIKEINHSLLFMFERIRYSEHKWLIYVELKVVAILTRLQVDYT